MENGKRLFQPGDKVRIVRCGLSSLVGTTGMVQPGAFIGLTAVLLDAVPGDVLVYVSPLVLERID